MDLGKNIYLARKKNGISQEELANKLDVSRQCISLWETNQTVPSISKVEMIAKTLNVSLDQLTGENSLVNLEKKNNDDEEIKKILIAKAIKIEKKAKIVFYISLANILLWLIMGLGILTSCITLILSLNVYHSKERKYSIYGIVVSSVFIFASIIRIIAYDYMMI